jgi:hypothetical protein
MRPMTNFGFLGCLLIAAACGGGAASREDLSGQTAQPEAVFSVPVMPSPGPAPGSAAATDHEPPSQGSKPVALAPASSPPQEVCSKRWKVSGGEYAGILLAPDGAGNVAVVAHGDDAVAGLDFGQANPSSRTDGYVGLLDGDCELVWSHAVLGGSLAATEPAIDSKGTITLLAWVGGTDFEIAGQTLGSSDDLENSWLVRLHGDGSYLDARMLNRNFSAEIEVGPGDSLLVSGVGPGATDFGGGAACPQQALGETRNGYTSCYFVAQLDADWTHLWTRGLPDSDTSPHARSDLLGNVRIVGSGTLELGSSVAASGPHLVGKLDAMGSGSWVTDLARSSRTIVGSFAWPWDRQLELDRDGAAFYLGYSAEGSLGGLESKADADPDNWWIAKIDADGNPAWSDDTARWHQARPESFTVAEDGHLLIAGSFGDRADLGAGELASEGERDGFIVELDAAGRPLWSMRLGRDHADFIRQIESDGDDVIWVAGWSGALTQIAPSSADVAPSVQIDLEELFVTKLRR